MATQRARGAALLRVALVLSFLAASDARSSGPASCDARSGHGASDSGGGGYTLAVSNASVDVTAVAPNTRLELLLTAPDGSAFKGFVMHAANAGAFAVADALVSERVESCHAGNAVGHRSASSKTRVRAYFTAPATGGAVTITAQAVESRMVVYETALELTVVEDGDADDAEDEAEDDAEDEAEDDAEDEAEDDARVDDRDASNASNASLASNASYALNASLASDVTLRWTVGPADATAVTPAVAASEVAFAIETHRADAASIAVAFQSREGEGAMFPAEAVIAWLAPIETTDDDAPGHDEVGHVGSYALTSYDAATGVVGPENRNLEIRDGSVERRVRSNGVNGLNSNVLIARFVARKDDVSRATSKRSSGSASEDLDVFSGEDVDSINTFESVRVAYAVSATAGKAYHDLGRGVAFVNFVTGNATRSVSVAARLKRTRFFAHGACALAAWFCFGFGTLVSAFFKTVHVHVPFFRNQNETTIKRRWFVAHVASQTCGALLAVAALAVALRESAGETGAAFDWARSDASDKKKAHGVCGVALVFCVAAQVALGAFREAKDGVREAKRVEKNADGDATSRATETTGGLDGSPIDEKENRKTRAPLRKAHVALGWLVALGGFANAAVGAGLFRRLVARDGAFADAGGSSREEDEHRSSVFSEAAWTGLAILGAGLCLRVVNGARERLT